MSPIWKGLIILSLAMNVVLTLRVFVSGGSTATTATTASDQSARPTGPHDPTLHQNETARPAAPAAAPALNIVDDNSALARKVKGELFPEIKNSASKSFPDLQVDKLDLTEGRFILVMKSNIDSRISRESARSLVTSIARSYTEKYPELKGRTPVVRFPGDPPSMGGSL